MAAVNERAGGQERAGQNCKWIQGAENVVGSRSDEGNIEIISVGRRWRNLARGNRRLTTGFWDRRWRSAGRAIRSKESADHLFRQRGLLEIDGQRQDLGWLAWRAGGRRLSK